MIGRERAHIPDFYITSLNLIVNCKSADNKFYRLRDIETEKAQDAAIEKTNYNYVKIYDNQFEKFTDAIEKIKYNIENKIQKRIIIENFEGIDKNLNILLG